MKNEKSDFEICEKVMDSLGITVDDVIAIEDSPSGVKSALGAGIAPLAFPGEMNSGKEFPDGPKIISRLSEVIAYIE